jgi:hypothetical protein
MTKQETILREAIRKEIRKELKEVGMNEQPGEKLTSLGKKAKTTLGLGQFKSLVRMMRGKGADEQFDTIKDLLLQFQLKPQAALELKNWLRQSDTKKGLTSRK